MALSINNVAYSWSMIQLTAPHLTGSNNANDSILSGVSSISWNIARNTAVNYGLGGDPVNRGFGNIVYTASITMDYNTIAKIRAAYGSLMDLGEFDLTISFANPLVGTTEAAEPSDDWFTHTIQLKGCFFNEDGMDVGQDDTNITKSFDLNPLKIEISPVSTGGETPAPTV